MKTGLRLMSFVAAVFLPIFAFAGAQLTYHGRLLKPDGTPVVSNNVKFKIQVRTPGAEDCLLFEETHTRDMSLSDGAFAITLNDGTASVVNTEPFLLDRVFQNRGSFSFAGGRCASGATYSPAATDGRRLAVQFDDGSTGGWESLPSQPINQVPQAIDSMTLDGFKAAELFRVVDGSGNPVAMAAWSQADYANLLGIVATGNTAGSAAGFTGTLSGDVTGAQATTVVGKIQGRPVDATAPAAGQVLKWNGSAWAPGADSGASGSVLSVAGTGAVAITGTASDPIVGVQDASTSQKGVVQLGSSSDTAAGLAVQANDSRLTDARAPTSHTHVVDEILSAATKYFGYKPNNVACADGEFMKWNAAQSRWECGAAAASNAELSGLSGLSSNGFVKRTGAGSYSTTATVSLTDMSVNGVMTNNTGLLVTDGTQLQNKACSAGDVLKWNAVSGWTCSADAGLTSESDPKVGANTTNFLSKWDGSALVASAVSESGGNVGIGTSSPTAQLQIASSTFTSVDVISSSASQSPAIQLYRDRGSSGSPSPVLTSDTLGTYNFKGYHSSGYSTSARIGAQTTEDWTPSHRGTDLFFQTTNTGTSTVSERMRIAASGNIGIGTASPSAIFHVVVPSNANLMFERSFADNAGPQLLLKKARGSTGSPAQVNSGDRIFSIVGNAYNDAGWDASNSVAILGRTTEAHTTAAMGTDLAFETTANGTTTRSTRMVIGNDGNVGIGTTSAGQKLSVAGTIESTSGGIKFPDGSTQTTAASAGVALPVKLTVFTSSGTWNRTSGATKASIHACGGGGGGGQDQNPGAGGTGSNSTALGVSAPGGKGGDGWSTPASAPGSASGYYALFTNGAPVVLHQFGLTAPGTGGAGPAPGANGSCVIGNADISSTSSASVTVGAGGAASAGGAGGAAAGASGAVVIIEY